MKKESLDEQIQKADQELESILTNINNLATRQQRLIGYRQCLVDMKESNNATPKNPGSS
jgi:chromosome segregation ATPase